MKQFENDIINSINFLERGGIILYPTDTIWGIGGDATNAKALEKIYRLKKREEKKSMIILVTRVDEIKRYVISPSKKIIDFLVEQKNPTTAIFAEATGLPGLLINKDGSIAIRIVKDDFCEMIIERSGKPLVSTSANISGENSPKNFSEINDVIKNGVDYICQHRQNEIKEYAPSSIIKLNDEGEIERIR